MAAAGKADKVEKLAGRNVVIPGDGAAHYWQDTKEIVSADERKFLEEIAAPDTGLDFKGETRQNPDLLFYSYEVQLEEGGPMKMNPIRGIVIDMFQRPASFDTGNDDKDETSDDKLRVACFVKLTRPCYVKGRSKKVREAHIGETVWVDLNQATNTIVRDAAPRRDKNGTLVGLAEIAIDPKVKEPFSYVNKTTGKSETRNAWRAGCYGGFNSGPSFRKYLGAEEIAKKLGSHIATPSIMNEADIARTLGIALPGSVETPQNGAPQLNA